MSGLEVLLPVECQIIFKRLHNTCSTFACGPCKWATIRNMENQQDEALVQYKKFVDGLLGWHSNSVTARWVREWGTPEPKGYCPPKPFDQKMRMFTPDQRKIIAQMLQDEFESGLFQAAVYLDEGYELLARIKEDGSAEGEYRYVRLPLAPFDEEIHDDLTRRRMGEPWPDEDDDDD